MAPNTAAMISRNVQAVLPGILGRRIWSRTESEPRAETEHASSEVVDLCTPEHGVRETVVDQCPQVWIGFPISDVGAHSATDVVGDDASRRSQRQSPLENDRDWVILALSPRRDIHHSDPFGHLSGVGFLANHEAPRTRHGNDQICANRPITTSSLNSPWRGASTMT